jgi:hypothetical protein
MKTVRKQTVLSKSKVYPKSNANDVIPNPTPVYLKEHTLLVNSEGL